MAKKRTQSAKTRPLAPSRLTMQLFAPGMSPLHRAGLGGLAATLSYIERAYKSGALRPDEVPGGPWANDQPPWEVDPLWVTLDFGQPTNARQYLQRLFSIAFGLKDRLIYLPGQYGDTEPPLPVRARLQQAITLTFLQHGRVRKLETPTIYSYQLDEQPGATLELSYAPCAGYKHQDGWQVLTAKNGALKSGPIEVSGPLHPGAIVRHVAYTSATKIEDTADHVLPLYFALVGCMALAINHGCAVLLVPEVTDLVRFTEIRPLLTPTTDRECQITSAGDAALQAQIRLWVRTRLDVHELPGFHASVFRGSAKKTRTAFKKKVEQSDVSSEPLKFAPCPSYQKSRVQVLRIMPGDEKTLRTFETALAELRPQLRSRSVKQVQGRGGEKTDTEKTEWFWVDSALRPLVADNLAQGRPWYAGFTRLMTAADPSSNRPLRDRLLFEKGGMHAMIEQVSWNDQGESTVVRAVHEAIRRRYGRIAEENQGNTAAREKRWQAEYERWRLAFGGAKTADQFRRALCDLLSRAGVNPVLQEQWAQLLPMITSSRWQLTRDLALLALASYSSKTTQEPEQSSLPETQEAHIDG